MRASACPALEAMLLGTPVMTSNTSSMPEVVGEAAIKVDPYDTRAMVEAIRALDADADLRGRLSPGWTGAGCALLSRALPGAAARRLCASRRPLRGMRHPR
jgi:glycosyltransferase involved in cell wall biosynthesis